MSRKPNLLLAPATDKARNSMMSSLVLGTGNVDIISVFLSAMNFSLRTFFSAGAASSISFSSDSVKVISLNFFERI